MDCDCIIVSWNCYVVSDSGKVWSLIIFAIIGLFSFETFVEGVSKLSIKWNNL